MKHSFLTMAALAVLLSGCSSDIRTDRESGKGNVHFECSVSSDVVLTKADPVRELPADLLPGTENFKLVISSSEGIVSTYENMSKYDQPMLPAGDYTAEFSYGDPEAEGNRAVYFTGEKNFTVVARKTSTEQVSLSLANSVYSLKFSDWFKKYYTEYQIDIRTESGLENAFSGSSSKPLEETAPVFVKAATKLYLSGSATKTNGTKVTFALTEICTTKARTWHTINVNASQVGEASLEITIDDTPVSIEEIPVELNPDA